MKDLVSLFDAGFLVLRHALGRAPGLDRLEPAWQVVACDRERRVGHLEAVQVSGHGMVEAYMPFVRRCAIGSNIQGCASSRSRRPAVCSTPGWATRLRAVSQGRRFGGQGAR